MANFAQTVPMTEQEVILVDEADRPIGAMEKIAAHRQGLLHRAFSVFIFNTAGEMLLQQRASNKYHSPNLWTNACCSHPAPGEATDAAALRRLREEMGFITRLQPLFHFTYNNAFDNGLVEHEFDHVYAGVYDGPVTPDNNEVQDYCFKSIWSISESISTHPQKFTVWFGIAFPLVARRLEDGLIEKLSG